MQAPARDDPLRRLLGDVDTTGWPDDAVEALRSYDAEIARLWTAGAELGTLRDTRSLRSWLETRNVLISGMGGPPHRPLTQQALDRAPDPDAQAIMAVLLASPNRDEPGALLAAAQAYAAIKAARDRGDIPLRGARMPR